MPKMPKNNFSTDFAAADSKMCETAALAKNNSFSAKADETAELEKINDFEEISTNISLKLNNMITAQAPLLSSWVEKKFIKDSSSPVTNVDADVQCVIAVVAPVAAGKSTLLNAICEYPILPAASGTTSSVPTYISRAKDHASEAITVYPLKKISKSNAGMSEIKFERSEDKKRRYRASDISENLFKELAAYVRFIMRGDGKNYITTVENIAYFMSSVRAVDIELYGLNKDKMALRDDDFVLSYEQPRHRLLLLMVLLCVYVNQNERNENKGEYRKQVNEKRIALLKKFGFPPASDYCVCLDWYSTSIPEGVTLIDLPGTGSDTKDYHERSSHTALVKGILYDADAVWVLISDNGTVQSDLRDAIRDAVEMDLMKNKVCIYNCKDKNPNNSKPVSDFIEKMPCLAGERCYVVNAVSGEYKYTQNGIKALNTKMASEKRNDGDDYEAEQIIEKLKMLYSDQRRAYPTYTTQNEIVQDPDVSYTLETFLKEALTDYAARLKYEVILKKAFRQAEFFETIKKELKTTLDLFKGINGQGPDIAKAVNAALMKSFHTALNDYTNFSIDIQRKIANELTNLNKEIGPVLIAAFEKDYKALIATIHNEWKTLITDGHENALKQNFLGNYSLRANHDNWDKFQKVGKQAENRISISAFSTAVDKTKSSMGNYRKLFEDHVNGLRKITVDFCNDYIKSFSDEYDKQRNIICKDEDGVIINDDLWKKFNNVKERLKKAIEDKMKNLCQMLCAGFPSLIEQGGVFDSVVSDTYDYFKKLLSDQILDSIRDDIRIKFRETNRIRLLSDKLDVPAFNKLLCNDFTGLEAKCLEKLTIIVNAIYGDNLGGNKASANFPLDLSDAVNSYHSDKIIGPQGAQEQIKITNNNIMDIINFATDDASNVDTQITDVKTAVRTWSSAVKDFNEIGSCLVSYGNGNVEKLYKDYKDKLAVINMEEGEGAGV